jgi:imidazolonepropionase-like amidohydrolase
MTDILISHGNLIDGTGAAPQPSVSVLVSGDEIVALGAAAEQEAAARAGVEVVDATGKTVMPGLIDAHVHSTFAEPQSNDELFFHRDQGQSAILAAWNAPKMLLAGCTSILDPDCLWNLGPDLRDVIEAGIVEGPRIAAGQNALLTSVGGTAGRLIPEEGQIGYAQVVQSVGDMIRIVRQQLKNGVDWVKIHGTGSIPTQPGEIQVWSLEEFKVVCDTAHELGARVVAHCRNASSTRDAARAGVDLILHCSYMDDDAIEAIVESGASIAPTWTFLANLRDFGDLVGANLAMQSIFDGEIKASAAATRKAYDAGVRVLTGSESGFSLTPYGHWHARELELFVNELGLTPLEAITCATRNGGFAMKLEGRLGTIEQGMLADVIVVDGDPSQDVTILQDRSKLAAVVSRGRSVNLDRPWPERELLAGEKVGNWSHVPLTWELVNGR